LGSSSFQFCSCLADSPRGPGGRSARIVFVVCSSCSCSALLSIRGVFNFWLGEVSDGPRVPGRQSACAWQTVRGCLVDSPRAPRGRSVIRGASLEFLLPFSDNPRLMPDGPRQGCGQSAIPCRTVRAAFADSPPRLAGQSARAWQLCSLVRFLPSSFILPCVLQGIVPKT
jgi:hypothetical protein